MSDLPTENQNGSKKDPSQVNFFTGSFFLALYLLVTTLLFLWGVVKLWPEKKNFSEVSIKLDSTFVLRTGDSLAAKSGNLPLLIDLSKKSTKTALQKQDSAYLKIALPLRTEEKPLSDRLVILLILLIGALGSNLHGLISLSGYVGNKTFESSWSLWYILRPIIGAILSLVFYLIIKAGYFKQVTENEFYTLAALAGLIGMFSKQALNKLSDIFDTVFASKKDSELKDKMDANPVPKLDKMDPDHLTKGSGDTDITLTGTGFIEKSKVKINNTNEIKPKTVKADQLVFILPASLMANAGTLQVMVCNPEPKGGNSNVLDLIIT